MNVGGGGWNLPAHHGLSLSCSVRTATHGRGVGGVSWTRGGGDGNESRESIVFKGAFECEDGPLLGMGRKHARDGAGRVVGTIREPYMN